MVLELKFIPLALYIPPLTLINPKAEFPAGKVCFSPHTPAGTAADPRNPHFSDAAAVQSNPRGGGQKSQPQHSRQTNAGVNQLEKPAL
jgi:hypothetical protein